MNSTISIQHARFSQSKVLYRREENNGGKNNPPPSTTDIVMNPPASESLVFNTNKPNKDASKTRIPIGISLLFDHSYMYPHIIFQ